MSAQSQPSAGRAIFWAGLVAGVLDIGYVFIVYSFFGATPVRILQSISTVLLGREAATKGGWATAALGLAMHFAIAYAVAAFFFAASRKFPWLLKHAAVSGALYGIAVWLVMNVVILPPLSAAKFSFPPPLWELILLAHVMCVGLPIALIVRHFSSPRSE